MYILYITYQDTPPLDEPIKPGPFPSISTPVHHPAVPVDTTHRHRRHTITRPDSALAMLSDEESDNSGQDHHETLDRISCILSNLLQEANDAVQRDQLELAPSSRPPPLCMDSSRSSSRRTSASLPTPVSPVSPKFVVSKTRRVNNRPISLPAAAQQQRRSRRGSAQQQVLIRRDPLVESFRRLDSSLALVDSLSRDLASPTTASHPSSDSNIPTTSTKQQHDNSSIALYFILPLLHIPHALISMVFDSLSVSSPQQQHLTSIITWALVFCLANVMVSTTVRPQQHQHQLPGSYQKQHYSSTNPLSLQQVRKRRVVRRSIYRKYTLPPRQSMVAITRSRTQPGTASSIFDATYSNVNNNNIGSINPVERRRHSF